ncbi:pyridoxamine 5'-phosphate oxidase [Chromobacterium subtsugae]|mgnify:CR=1 FL=1|uniref:Pyridoxine/pyridoxamine 5'-phosphate oxidase n=1 Tax=Chromobacterium subtsugae TaxID=251747 RepID=A0ABS7F7P4_9NEIS|nr:MULTISPECIES: pyridoxamine 5'-phosphate oxidase [Chromobacterium]KUM02089.1 pyridoxine 5'-phosphate oxidase [Chromobacterium subtsugae]KZE83184.1 pyridoxine 5'-phosphate oxidase [Chromobacterium sp. F49]MBW7567144.1 pyridoxamine 5'-phosphate oxidase [Chromobacterium subtsugae]MBW8286114.1 pyridoxamine 5'-phosphate oxidase [Chromobacterium subtsugae]OBU86369.1 pyridoxine 5'-phosphate oxidase [Chromobacterium subtsugae]
MSLNLADVRLEYSKKELSPEDCLPDAMAQFEVWLNEALTAQVPEPTAMNVASVGADGRPASRIVLLKGVENGQLLFYTNYLSRKGQQLDHNPHVALAFFWPELERQVRIEGTVARVAAEVSDAYFASRPYTSRLGAWASEQSSEIASKAVLVTRAAMFGARHPINVPRPPHWGGYAVTPERIEFWQGRPSRLHDRVVYTLQDGGGWQRSRLAP